jgi:hypothetical protein
VPVSSTDATMGAVGAVTPESARRSGVLTAGAGDLVDAATVAQRGGEHQPFVRLIIATRLDTTTSAAAARLRMDTTAEAIIHPYHVSQ